MYIGAIDIGGTKTIVAIVDTQGEIIEKITETTNTDDCIAHLERCSTILKDMTKKHGFEASQLIGIGVNLPGMVDQSNGILISAPFARWEQIAVADYFRNTLGNKNIYIDNDVNSCALGEKYFGYKDKFKDYIWVTVSTGIGSAVVLDSKLVRGCCGLAGEMGHLKVEYEQPKRCPCGQLGCLEAHASGTGITAMVREKIENDSSFKDEFDKLNLRHDAQGCAVLAKAGNSTAKDIYIKAADYIARGISYCVNMLNPQAVIIGGGVAKSLELMLPTIEESLKKYVVAQSQNVSILYTKLGYEAALLGAASLVVQNLKLYNTNQKLEQMFVSN